MYGMIFIHLIILFNKTIWFNIKLEVYGNKKSVT